MTAEGFSPNFDELAEIDEKLLAHRLEAARAAISHAGEKGRSLEGEAAALLRTFLPSEYGLSTGFIAYHDGNAVKLTPQLDIVIYDAVRTAPLARLSTCDVFPLEGVYGYVEVKASLVSTSDQAKDKALNSIEACLETNAELRKLTKRTFWVPVDTSSTKAEAITFDWLSLRAYVMAFSPQGETASTPATMAQRIADYSARLGGSHVHGVLVAGSAFYSTVASEADTPIEDRQSVVYTTARPFAAFKGTLLQGLTRFTRFDSRWTPAIDLYRRQHQWSRVRPKR